MANEPQVVVLGAGFAGVAVLKKLEKAPVKVTLVDKNDYHAFLPLLYQVATSELGPDEIGFPAQELLERHNEASFQQATVQGIDLDARKVILEDLPPLSYDYLVVALGAVVNFFGTPGAAEHAFPLYTLDDATRLKEHISGQLEAADKDPSLIDRGALRFSVVGGGSTGVEIAGAIAEVLTHQLRDEYPNLPLERAGVDLYELGPSLLPPFKPKLRDYARRALEDRDVTIHLGEGVVEVDEGQIKLKSGATVPTGTLVWAAGLSANPLAGELGAELVKGRTPAQPDLSLEGHPEVFVIGDMAMITDTKTNEQLPQLGSVAQQAGFHTGDNIARLVAGKKTEPFEYNDKGTMAAIGRGAAVVQLRNGRTMTGQLAWMTWLGVHLALLSGGREKGLTFIDWGWNVISKSRSRRINGE